MLTATDLTREANGKRLLDRVSVRFESGKLNLIIGPNGAGKSTLLKLLGGQSRTSAGTIHYGGIDAAQLGLAALSRFRAILSQSVEIAFPLRVWEVVMMGRYPHFSGRASPRDEQACDEVMRLFDVASMAGRN